MRTAGHTPGEAPPGGRRRWEFSGVESTSAPTEDWPSLVRSGYGTVFGVLIDGIPYSFGERKLYTVAGVEAYPPSNDYTRSAALMVSQGLSVSVEVDRATGVASGRALDLVLRRQSLDDEGLLTVLFKVPGLSTLLASAVADPADTVFAVVDTTGFASSGTAYIGRECIAYTSTDATHFAGITRGVAGMPHYHTATTASGYAEVTDTPKYWRGRLVTLFEHLVSPEGRFLGERWCTVDTYCRQVWRGYIGAVPQETPAGKVLRCLPAVRMANQGVGGRYVLTAAQDDRRMPLLWFTATDVVRVHGDGSGTTVASGPSDAGAGVFTTLGAWCQATALDVTAALGSGNGRMAMASPTGRDIQGHIYFPAGTGGASLTVNLWCVPAGVYGTMASHSTGFAMFNIPVDFNATSSSWVVLRAEQTEDWDPTDIPETGFAYIESGDKRERVKYSGKALSSDQTNQGDLVAIRLVARDLDGSGRADPWARYDNAPTITIVGGVDGSWSDVAQTLMTSSGTGARGDHDTLGFGYGAGFPADWLDVAAFDDPPLASQQVIAASDQRTGLGDVLGGWLALWQRCLVQRRNAAGAVVLSTVSTEITETGSTQTVTAADVLLDGHGAPELIDAPNTVVIESSGYQIDTQRTIYRDTSRVQAEDVHALTLLCPGVARGQDMSAHALSILRHGDGQATVAFDAPSWCELQPGDRVTLTTAHPLLYDWTTGAYAPASVEAVVTAWDRDLWSGVVRIVCLLRGSASVSSVLCPSTRVVQVVSTTVVEVSTDQLGSSTLWQDHFDAADVVTIYEPGNEAARTASLTIASVDQPNRRITFTGSLPTWASPASWLTFDDYSSTVARQQACAFVRSDRRWS